MSDPQVSISGPYDQSGTVQGPTTPLYLTEEAVPETETDTKKQDIPGKGDDEALLAPFDGQTAFSYKGVFNQNRLVRAYSNLTPLEAVREWLFEVETLCLPKQGRGFRLKDDESGFVLDPTSGTGVLVEEVEWTVSAGDGLYGEWRVDVQRAEGPQPAENNVRDDKITERRNESNSNDFTDERLFVGTGSSQEYELGSVEEMKYTRSIDLNVQQMIHNSDVPQTGLPESGVEGTFRLQGIMTTRDLPSEGVSALPDWVHRLNTSFHGEYVRIYETVTDRVFGGAVSSSSATMKSGSPNRAEYTIELDIGSSETFGSLS